MKNNMNTEWITDRLPTAEDALTDGSVWTFYDGKVMMWSYDGVQLGTPWQRIPTPEPYVKPKRWTVEFSAYDNTWIMRDNVEGWVRLLYIDRCHRDAAQQIEDIYNKVNP
jgi:hypothetical protein